MTREQAVEMVAAFKRRIQQRRKILLGGEVTEQDEIIAQTLLEILVCIDTALQSAGVLRLEA